MRIRGEIRKRIPRFHPACKREVRSTREQDNSDTRRPKNRPGEARRHFRRSVEQLAVAEGASMTPERWMPAQVSCRLCLSVTGKPRPGSVPDSSGVVDTAGNPQGARTRTRPSLPVAGRVLLRQSQFDRGSVSFRRQIVKSGKQQIFDPAAGCRDTGTARTDGGGKACGLCYNQGGPHS